MYGKEVIIDMHECDVSKFNRTEIEKYFIELCKFIDMKRDKLVWWDDKYVPKKYRQTECHTKGTTAVQFILTSSIVIHTLDLSGQLYLNIFSCKDFSENKVFYFTQHFFKGKIIQKHVIDRI